MNEAIKIILSLSLSGTLLILILLLCKPLYRKRLSKQWQYYIWLIVIARLLLPFTPETSIVGTLIHNFDVVTVQTEVNPQNNVLPQNNFMPGNATDDAAVIASAELISNEKLEAESSTLQSVLLSVLLPVKQNIWNVWLIVAIALVIRKVTFYQSFVKYIRAGKVEISDIELWERFGELVKKSGVKRSIGIYTNSLISSPLLIGFFRPSIMLPTTEISQSDFECTVLHELTHYKRLDMFYKWLVQLTVCLHWFNPLVYLMSQEVSRVCELSCDEAIIRNLDKKSQRAYGDTLLNALEIGGSYKNSLASVKLTESKELLKERLDAIMNFKKKTKLISITTSLISCVLLCGFAFTGAYAATQPNIANETKTIINNDVNYDDHSKTEDTEIKTATIKGETWYLIDTQAQLRAMGSGTYPLSGNYMLNADITLNKEMDWVPIGTIEQPFTGKFTGNGFEIIDLTITNPEVHYIGMFGFAENAHIYNVTLRNVDIMRAFQRGDAIAPILAWGKNCKSYDNQIIDPVEAENTI